MSSYGGHYEVFTDDMPTTSPIISVARRKELTAIAMRIVDILEKEKVLRHNQKEGCFVREMVERLWF